MYRPRDGRNVEPLTNAEVEKKYRAIVTNRDKSVLSEKAALGYFENEIIFCSASRALWRMDPENGGLGAILNDLNTVGAIREINRGAKAMRKGLAP